MLYIFINIKQNHFKIYMGGVVDKTRAHHPFRENPFDSDEIKLHSRVSHYAYVT